MEVEFSSASKDAEKAAMMAQVSTTLRRSLVRGMAMRLIDDGSTMVKILSVQQGSALWTVLHPYHLFSFLCIFSPGCLPATIITSCLPHPHNMPPRHGIAMSPRIFLLLLTIEWSQSVYGWLERSVDGVVRTCKRGT